jgi:pimeloyl-ACP methyl ester carboxylesterase
MGGLIGMVMAASANSGMRKFVVNDVGPEIERAALERIAVYVSGRVPTFPDYMSLFNAAQVAIAPFGPLTDEQKHHIIGTSCRKRDDGQWEFNTDPKIGEAFVAGLKLPPIDLWPLWNSISIPTLVLRGRTSDLLSETIFNKMIGSPSNNRGITVEDTGHAPMLMDAPTIAEIRAFLLSP